ncbi:phenylalanine--tRNA ligase subunit beta [candidate division KSB1 bacterium]
MLAPINWIREFVDFDLTPDELAHQLTMTGLEVETVDRFRPDFTGVKVVRIVSSQPLPGHPDLSLCRLDHGGKGAAEVVCGAPNANMGLLTAWVPPGGRLPDGETIKSADIHGQPSEGMLCSPAELGLSTDPSRIIAIDEDVKPGADLVEALDLADDVLSIALNPNRPDCLGIYGIAREVSVITGSRLRRPDFKVRESGPPATDFSQVRIDAPDMCPRYVLRLISGCEVRPSPLWITRRLLACGLRPINNLVDITNYVMMELGQPLHAFDLDRLEERRIVVRRAGPKETMTTLDGAEQKLTEELLVIADARQAVAVAGVMGGEASGITDRTRDVLLESAYFDPGTIRRSAKFLCLSTDSSHRFERGVDIEMTPNASARAAQLIKRLSGGKVATGMIDAYPRKVKTATVRYRPQRASAVLGCHIPWDRQRRILKSLGFSISALQDGAAQVAVPSYRVDMDREIDLIEEVGRHYGYHRIPARLFAGVDIPMKRTATEMMRERLTEFMVGSGFKQILTTSFVAESNWSTFRAGSGDRESVILRNPMSIEQAYLRPSLVPTMADVVRGNLNAGLPDLRLFETGAVFGPSTVGQLPVETEKIVALITGAAQPPSWTYPGRPVDIFTVKGLVEGLMEALNVTDIEFNPGETPDWAHSSSLDVISGKVALGSLGELSSRWLDGMEIGEPVYFFDLTVAALVELAVQRPPFSAFSRLPSAKRDLALIVPDDISAGRVNTLIRAAAGDRLESLVLFDYYRGRQVESGYKSLAYSLSFRDPGRTLTDGEIDPIINSLLAELKQRHGIRLRS